MEQLNDLKLGMECDKVYTVLFLFNFYVGYLIRYAGLHKSQAGIKIAGRSINIHRYEDDTSLMEESKELKSLLMRRGDAKIDLKLNIQKDIHKKKILKFMASSPTTSRHIDEEKVEIVAEYFLGLQNHYRP